VDDLTPAAEKSEQMLCLIKAIVANQVVPSASTSVEDLVLFCAGRLEESRVSEMDTILAGSTEIRRRLLQVFRELETIRLISPVEILVQSEEESLKGEVARAWLAVLGTTFDSKTSPADWLSNQTWQATIEQSRGKAISAILATGALWLAVRNAASGRSFSLATSRSGGQAPGQLEGFSNKTGINIRSKVDSDGALNASLTVTSGLANVDGRGVIVSVISGAQLLPIYRGTLIGGRLEFSLPLFGEITGIPEGPVDGATFCISLEQHRSAGNATRIYALVDDGDTEPIQCELLEEPHVEEQLVCTIAVPSSTVQLFGNGHLVLEIVMGPNLSQVLGEWPVKAWENGPQRLTVPIPGLKQSFRPFSSILRVRVKNRTE